MSEKLTPEQLSAITQAVEAHLKATGQNIGSQQIPGLGDLMNNLPNLITNLVTGPAGGAVNIVTGILNGMLGTLSGAAGLLAGSNLAPNLVNIIQKQIPTQNAAQQPEQK